MSTALAANPGLRLWSVLTSSIATRARLLALGALGLGAVLLGVGVRLADPTDRAGAAWSVVNGYGLSLLVPVVALVFASASPRNSVSAVTGLVFPLVVTVVALAVTARSLDRGEVT